MTSVDVLCVDSRQYDPPVWNEIQALSLNKTGLFKINKLVTNKATDNPLEGIMSLIDSEAKVLISITPEQQPWFGNRGFGLTDDNALYPSPAPAPLHPSPPNWKELREKYEKIVFIVDEPIYTSPVKQAMYRHEKMLGNLKPDVVFYPSNHDFELSTARKKLKWFSVLDVLFPNKTPIGEKADEACIAYTQHGSWGRYRQRMINKIKNKCKIPINVVINDTYAAGSTSCSRAKVCFQPPHPLTIHWSRFLRAWHQGTLPVVVNPDGWYKEESFIKNYRDILDQNNKSCLLVNESDMDKAMKDLADQDFVQEKLLNIQKLDLSDYNASKTWEKLYNIL